MTFYNEVGCSDPMCPRFNVVEPCPAIPKELICTATDVTRISLRNLNLNGTISNIIGQLSALTYFRISEAPTLSGTIPSEVGLCTEIGELNFKENNLDGVIPNVSVCFIWNYLKRMELS